jgi:hypothetical protein
MAVGAYGHPSSTGISTGVVALFNFLEATARRKSILSGA